MAWNNPGNNSNNSWNHKQSNQGPPDLDAFLKKLISKFGSIFNSKSYSSSGGSGGRIGAIAVMVAVILVVSWAVAGFYTIKEAERGVVLRFGKFNRIVQPGLHWLPAFVDSATKVNISQILDANTKGFMLTEDENVVQVEMNVQYRISNPERYLYSVVNAEDSLGQAIDSALRFVVGHAKMSDILTSGRELVRQSTEEQLKLIIKPYDMGLEIVDVNFLPARPPHEVKAAFDDAISAQEDEQRYIREAEAYVQEVEPIARGTVKRLEQEALAYKEKVTLQAKGEVARFIQLLPEYQQAPIVTRKRLYLETMEAIYGATNKVFIDTKNANNLLYLPIDKLIQQGQNTAPANQPALSAKPSSIQQRSTKPNPDNVIPRSFERSSRR